MIAGARITTVLITLGLGLALSLRAPAQTEALPKSSEGYFISPYGRLHMLIVYAEMEFDSSYAQLDPEKNPEGGKGWKVHRLPYWREKIISPTPDGDGFMTRYFRQASFGRFEVTGDFLDVMGGGPDLMPLGGAMLADDKIKLLEDWILAGAKDD